MGAAAALTAGGCSATGPGTTPANVAATHPLAGQCVAGTSPLKPVSSPNQSATVALASFSSGPLASKTVAFVADEDDKSLVMVDVDSKKELSSTKLGATPGQVMILEDGRVLVSLRDKNQLAVFHAAEDGSLVAGCAVDTSAEPIALALTPDKSTLLVTAGWGHALESFDAASLAMTGKTSLPREPRTVVVDDDGKVAYVTHAVGGRVSVVDLATMRSNSTLDVVVNPQQLAQEGTDKPFSLASAVTSSVGDGNGEKPMPGRFGTRMGCQGYPMVKTTAPKGRVLAPQILVDPGDPENRAQGYGDAQVPTEVASVGVIDAGTQRFVNASFAVDVFRNAEASADPDGGECLLPRGAAVDDSSSTLLVTCLGIDAVVAYDATSANPASIQKARWNVGSGPTGIAVDQSHSRAVVWSQFERSLQILDLNAMGDTTDGSDENRIALSPMAEPLSLPFLLGRQIFHSTGDARVSRDGRACASCHPDGRDDAITWSTPDGPRRTIMLAGRLSDTAPFSWLGANKDVREHVGHTFERLNGQGLRNVEFEALLTYVSTMAPPPKEGNADAELVKKGEQIFNSSEAECASCHANGGTDGRNHDLGVKATADRKAAFNTPALTYLSGRGPFFHDGRYQDLRQLLIESDGTMGHTKQLGNGDLDALEAYLNSL
ncbi:MAG: cytochrome c peroxidase [Polyangiaceae bacterium]